MISRTTTILMFALQGVSLVGLLAIGSYVYQSRMDAVSGGSTAGLVERSGTTASHSGVVAPEGKISAQPKSDLMREEQTVRLQRLEEQIANLARVVANNVREVTPGNTAQPASKGAAAASPIADLAERSRLRAQADLDSRHTQEATVSAWGQSAAAAINRAYAEASNSDSFFSQYRGDLATDCRNTVCRLTWSPNSATSLPDEARAELLEQAQMDLIALAASAQDAGQVRVSINNATDPPSIQVLVDHSGGEPMPSPVSRYLDSGKHGQ